MIIQLEEAKRTLLAMQDDVKELASALKIDKIKDDAEELEQKTMVPNFWDDAENSSKILRELKQIKDTLEEYEELKTVLEDTLTLAEMGIEENDESVVEEVLAELESEGILGGYPTEKGILWCVTEVVTKAEMDRAVAIVKEVLAR